MSGIARDNSLKRMTPNSSSMTSSSIDHLLAKCAITFLMGHVATHEYFSEIFSVFICLILTKSEFEVSGYSQGNLLYSSVLVYNFAVSLDGLRHRAPASPICASSSLANGYLRYQKGSGYPL